MLFSFKELMFVSVRYVKAMSDQGYLNPCTTRLLSNTSLWLTIGLDNDSIYVKRSLFLCCLYFVAPAKIFGSEVW